MPGKRLLTRDEFETYVRNLERRLASVGISSVVTDESVTVSSFLELSDTPASYIPGLVWVNAAENALVISGNKNPDVPPTSPNALDDEFEGGGAIDVKWTKVNDPGFDQTTHEGYLYLTLAEATVNVFDNYARLHQTAPTDETAWTIEAKVTMGITGVGPTIGEWSEVAIYLGNSTDDEFVGSGMQINDNWADQYYGRMNPQVDNGAAASILMSSNTVYFVNTVQWVYLKLVKTTANSYTSPNTYQSWFSYNGIIWQQAGECSKTFTTTCDEIGLFYRAPTVQTGVIVASYLCDWFRKVA